MIIKKYEAETEEDAIKQARDELGKDAVVMNIKTTKPKGFLKFMRKSVVEVTAAVDENPKSKEPKTGGVPFHSAPVRDREQEVSAIEKKLNSLQELLEAQMMGNAKNAALVKEEAQTNSEHISQIPLSDPEEIKTEENEVPAPWDMQSDGKVSKASEPSRLSSCMNLIYSQLLNNEVDEKYINDLTSELNSSIRKDAQVDQILGAVYQKIVLKLGAPETIELTPGKTKYVFFVGPTGVGKTTTIAKIASELKINQGADVALLTADTYRIAAVDQLRTYANILGIPLSIVYSASEISDMKAELDKHDVVLIDTAGRSDKSMEQINDIKMMLRTIPDEHKETYLVLSATTKYRDLVRTASVYRELTDIRLIFTKLDETSTIGSIYNIRLLTGAPLSYTTFGQNVPNDIGKADAQDIAKQLLSGA